MRMRVGLIAFVLLLLASCSPPPSIPELPPVGRVTAIYITANGMGFRPIASVLDASRVADVVAFVNSRRSGWTTPWYGVPGPAVVAQLCDGQRPMGHFGAGVNFFETNRGCTFCSRAAAANEVKAFLDLLQIDARYLDIRFNAPSAEELKKSHPEVCGRPL
jgi:hypothetical protein